MNKRKRERWILSEKIKKKLLLHESQGRKTIASSGSDGINRDVYNRFRDRPFYCWDTAFLGKRDCCFNHIIGLPINEKTGEPQPLFDYERELYQDWEHYKNIWIKKATGLGISEFFLRLMLWLSVRDQSFQNRQMCIIVGPNLDLAKKLIRRLKYLVLEFPGVFQRETEYAVEVNGCLIQAYPSNNLGSYRSLTSPIFIFMDEADFFRPGEWTDVRHTSERYIAKSNPWIIMVSTPRLPGGLFEQIENEPEDTCIYKRKYLPYTVGINKIYSQEEINRAKRSPSFEREYNLQYGYGLGNVFLPPEIDYCTQIKYNPSKINHACPISMGIDPGWGSSKTAFCVLMLEDSILKVIYAKEFERPSTETMLNLAVQLKGTYKPQKIYVDAAQPQFIRDLKIQIREPSDFETVIARAKHDKVDIEHRMKVIPIGFNEWGRELLGRFQTVVSKGWFALSPTEHKDLVVQMRMAKAKENGNLEKEENANSTYDVFDSCRLALKQFNMPRV